MDTDQEYVSLCTLANEHYYKHRFNQEKFDWYGPATPGEEGEHARTIVKIYEKLMLLLPIDELEILVNERRAKRDWVHPNLLDLEGDPENTELLIACLNSYIHDPYCSTNREMREKEFNSQCIATTKKQTPCRNFKMRGSEYCQKHQ